MPQLTDRDKGALLKLARSSIRARLAKDAAIERPAQITRAMNEKRGCFVTLHENNDLRGCIGIIEPAQALVRAVEENAVNAAFRDPRFAPLTRDELEQVTLEISVLTPPQILEYQDPEDLIRKLKPGIHGVILSKGWQKATFLPQVWEQLPEAEVFLEYLCRKAGMDGGCWRRKDILVKTYQAEYFSESDQGL